MNERIKEKEEKLNKLLQIVNKLKKNIDLLEKNKDLLTDINNYYGSNEYYIDLEAYDKGQITTPCGVLSEDTIWDLLNDLREQKTRIDEILLVIEE